MTMRIFCDHCGNTISGHVNKFSFGPQQYANYGQQVTYMPTYTSTTPTTSNLLGPYVGSYTGNAGNTAIGIQGLAQQPMQMISTNPNVKTETIDLCDHCVNIWMNRVRNLCRASDPPSENVQA